MLDVPSLLAFAAGGSVIADKTYLQLGSGAYIQWYRNPMAVVDGVLVTDADGRPALRFDSPDQWSGPYGVVIGISLHARYSILMLVEVVNPDARNYMLLSSHGTNPFAGPGAALLTRRHIVRRGGSGISSGDTWITQSDPVVVTGSYDLAVCRKFQDTAQQNATPGALPNDALVLDMTIFARGDAIYPANGKLVEVLILDDYDISADPAVHAAIVANMLTAWPPGGSTVADIAAAVDGVSAVSGAPGEVADIAAAVDGVSAVSGAPGEVADIAAAVDGVSAVSGAPDGVAPQGGDLAADVSGSSTVSGGPEQVADVAAAAGGGSYVTAAGVLVTDVAAAVDGVSEVSIEEEIPGMRVLVAAEAYAGDWMAADVLID
jgi:hypothetical protein